MTGAQQPPYTAATTTLTADRCLNWIPERAGGSLIFRGRRGLGRDGTFSGGGRGRGLYAVAAGTDLYAVSGTKVFRATDNFAAALAITLSVSTGHVQMADNGTHMFLAARSTSGGSKAVVFVPASATLIDVNTALGTAPGLPATLTTVRYLGGYLVALGTSNAGRFFYSAHVTDPTLSPVTAAAYTWPALNYANAQSCPDGAVGLEVLHNQLYVLGTRTVEVWDVTGDATTPFAPVPGAPLTVGCLSPHAVTATTQAVYWLATTAGGQPSIYRTVGYSAQRISTPLIEQRMAGWGSITGAALGAADVVVNVEDADGHVLVQWAPQGSYGVGDDAAVCYDEGTGLWCERASLMNGRQNAAAWRCHAFYAGSHYWTGDDGTAATNAVRFISSNTTYVDDSSIPITRQRTWPETPPGFNRTRWNSLDALFSLGSVSSAAAVTTLAWTDDNGGSSKSMTTTGVGYSAVTSITMGRASFQRLGMSRQRTFTLTYDDTSTATLLETTLTATPGTS